MTLDSAFAAVSTLVEQFHAREAYFLAREYDEASVRKDFIDKLFIALGWDVNHDTQTDPYRQEVKIENRVKTGIARRRADYAFFTAPNYRDSDVRFFVEAKKPSRSLANVDDYHQTIRYAWNRSVSVSVLTDFEEFHIIDCRHKPDPRTAPTRKIKAFHYSDYTDPEKFAEIYWLFSREAVGEDSLERYAETLKGAKGKSVAKGNLVPVDEAFLETLDVYRDQLARGFKNRNPALNGEALTEAVQRTLDRIVFIRFLEDKMIEEDRMKEFGTAKGSTWSDFIAYCRSLDPKYNGLIFKHHRIIDEQTFAEPDEQTFGSIIRELTDSSSPYNFDQIPISILGSIYERFLGKIITVTDKRAKVVDRPEVAHAGGVVYTPEYIVRHIVQRTIGERLGDATNGETTPDDIAKMRFADIACGSGSFLIEVYSELLDWHTRYYQAFPDRAKKGETVTRDGVAVLSLKKRREILTNNVFGTDIDFQATEVTTLSLYLKLLEEATLTETHQLSFIKEKLLPDLRGNIVCGNTIVGTDYWGLFDDEEPDPMEDRTVNALDFSTAFRDVMRSGGFDSIVGNPPYVRQETLGERFKKYASTRYAVYQGTADLYTYFIERGVNLLRPGGILGYIVANKWMRANYGKPLRTWLKGHRIDALIDFGDLPVFETVTTYPCVLFLRKDKPRETFRASVLKTLEFDSLAEAIDEHGFTVNQSALDDGGWALVDESAQRLLAKIWSVGMPLSQYVNGRIYRGVLTGLNEAFVIDAETRERLIAENPKSEELIKPFLLGRDIKRYERLDARQYLVFARRGIDIDHYPAIKRHLTAFKARLMPKPKGYSGGSWKGRKPGNYQWYEVQDTIDYHLEFEKEKLLLPDIALRLNFTLDTSASMYCANTCYLIPVADRYLLGVLNSCLIDFVYRNMSSSFRGGYLRAFTQYLVQLPIRPVDPNDPEEKAIHDKIVSLVNQRMEIGERLRGAITDHDTARHEVRIQGIEDEIDRLVYGLYGLTEEEIRIVEGAGER